MHEGSRLLVFEMIVPDECTAKAASARLSDMLMLVVHGGRERTLSELDSLIGRAGLKMLNVHDTGTPLTLLEAAVAR
jgi:hypothetical protein